MAFGQPRSIKASEKRTTVSLISRRESNAPKWWLGSIGKPPQSVGERKYGKRNRLSQL